MAIFPSMRIMGLLIALALAGCSREKAQYEKDFMEACVPTSGGNARYCKCVISALEDRHSVSELRQFDRQPTEAFMQEAGAAMRSCLLK